MRISKASPLPRPRRLNTSTHTLSGSTTNHRLDKRWLQRHPIMGLTCPNQELRLLGPLVTLQSLRLSKTAGERMVKARLRRRFLLTSGGQEPLRLVSQLLYNRITHHIIRMSLLSPANEYYFYVWESVPIISFYWLAFVPLVNNVQLL